MVTINFNGGIFEVTSFDSDGCIEEILRSTQPKIKVSVFQREGELKIHGWKNYQPFTIIVNGGN